MSMHARLLLLTVSICCGILISVAQSIITPTIGSDGQIVVIDGDYGGNVAAYAVYAQWLYSHGAKVKVIGICKSACTILSVLPRGRFCVTDTAELDFHAGTTPELTATMKQFYSPRVLSWIENQGGLTQHWLQLRGSEMLQLFDRCE